MRRMMAIPKRKERHPLAQKALEGLKLEVARDLGYIPNVDGEDAAKAYRQALDNKKFEVARDLHIPLKQDFNGDLTTREAGAIGGRLGGRIGGQMVRQMMQYAQELMVKNGHEN